MVTSPQIPKYMAWLKQAQNDFLWAQDSFKAGHYAQTCFIAQQIGEKAVKALGFSYGFDLIKSHSIVKILQELNTNGELIKAGRKLDLYYISTRYPDALPDCGIPYEYFDETQASEALEMASCILSTVDILIKAQTL